MRPRFAAICLNQIGLGRQLESDGVAVEVNQQIVPRGEHEAHQLQDGDQLEVVSLVGGG